MWGTKTGVEAVAKTGVEAVAKMGLTLISLWVLVVFSGVGARGVGVVETRRYVGRQMRRGTRFRQARRGVIHKSAQLLFAVLLTRHRTSAKGGSINGGQSTGLSGGQMM